MRTDTQAWLARPLVAMQGGAAHPHPGLDPVSAFKARARHTPEGAAMLLCDRCITLAEDARKSGLPAVAGSLLDLALRILDESEKVG